MHFRIFWPNHDDSIQTEDQFELLRLLVDAVGYQAYYDHRLTFPDCCYLVVDHFTDQNAHVIDRLRAIPFILVATEHITGETFNDFGNLGKHYSDRGYWQNRYRYFMELAPYARAIWCAVDDPEQ